MKAKSVRRTGNPGYPTRVQVWSDPGLLSDAVAVARQLGTSYHYHTGAGKEGDPGEYVVHGRSV